MRTVKEVSKITGISVRTLHYYDEIGLFKPTLVSERDTGFMTIRHWRSYSRYCSFENSICPLRRLRRSLKNPDLDKNELLKSQQKLLILKKGKA